MPSILIENLTDEEKRQLDIIKAEVGARTWRELILKAARMMRDSQGGEK